MSRWFFKFAAGEMKNEVGGFTNVAVLVVPRDTDPDAYLLEASLWAIAVTQPADSGLTIFSGAYTYAANVLRKLLAPSSPEGVGSTAAYASTYGDNIISTAGLPQEWCVWVNERVNAHLEELRADESDSIVMDRLDADPEVLTDKLSPEEYADRLAEAGFGLTPEEIETRRREFHP